MITQKLREHANLFINTAEFTNDLITQVENVIDHPARVHRVIVLPDAHVGKAMPIGCVCATKHAIVPNMVGVDIGCSMSLVKTSLKREDVTEEDLKRIIGGSKEYKGGIYANIPVGMKHNNHKQDSPIFAQQDRWTKTTICLQEYESAQHQIGTLGGGNHFIEIQVGEDGYVYVMIHSGSRNLGYKVCNHYNKIAEDLCTKYFQAEVVKNKLAFLPEGTKEYEDYMTEMNICIDFARENHLLMQKKVTEIINHVMGGNVKFDEPITTTHNYASLEHHWGENLLIHRKGAIMAREGVIALIPGSQGTASYIVEGLGHPASLCSASHGSGRKMSRAKAKAELNLKDEQAKMAGIVHCMNHENDLEEAPSAYKDIDDVIKQESDLVKPIMKLRPIAVVKGN